MTKYDVRISQVTVSVYELFECPSYYGSAKWKLSSNYINFQYDNNVSCCCCSCCLVQRRVTKAQAPLQQLLFTQPRSIQHIAVSSPTSSASYSNLLVFRRPLAVLRSFLTAAKAAVTVLSRRRSMTIVSQFAPCRPCYVCDPDPNSILCVTAYSSNNRTKKKEKMGYKRLNGARCQLS